LGSADPSRSQPTVPGFHTAPDACVTTRGRNFHCDILGKKGQEGYVEQWFDPDLPALPESAAPGVHLWYRSTLMNNALDVLNPVVDFASLEAEAPTLLVDLTGWLHQGKYIQTEACEASLLSLLHVLHDVHPHALLMMRHCSIADPCAGLPLSRQRAVVQAACNQSTSLCDAIITVSTEAWSHEIAPEDGDVGCNKHPSTLGHWHAGRRILSALTKEPRANSTALLQHDRVSEGSLLARDRSPVLSGDPLRTWQYAPVGSGGIVPFGTAYDDESGNYCTPDCVLDSQTTRVIDKRHSR